MQTIFAKEKLSENELAAAVEIIRNGGLVIYPTDTAYGLGVLASSRDGVEKLLEYKGARGGKAVSVAVGTRKMAEEYVTLNDDAKNLYEKYLPGALTVVSNVRYGLVGNEKGQIDGRFVLEIDGSENKTLGIRIPDSEIVHQITEALGEGITSTSANISGGETPYSVDKLLETLPEEKKAMIDLVIDAGELPEVETSVIVDATVLPMKILRGLLPEIFISNSEEETYDIAAEVLKAIGDRGNDKSFVILLHGEMGAGKTQFVKGLAKAMGVAENVISPTFVLERQYKLENSKFSNLYHYDLWRVNSKEESRAGEFVENLGIRNALKPGNILAIEWPENIAGIGNNLKNFKASVISVSISQIDEGRKFILKLP